MKQFEKRALALVAGVAATFTVVGVRLWSLQIKHGSYYASQGRQNYLRKLPIPAPRGNIVTSNGVTIASSKPSWTLYYLNPGVAMPGSEVKALAGMLSVSPHFITSQLASEAKILSPYDPVPITSNLTNRQMTVIDENIGNLPNIRIQPVAERYYPYGSTMGNIIGYISSATLDTTVGSAGLEAQYQKYLAGSSGGEYAVVNSLGQLVKLYGQIVPTPGDTLHLTINWRLEQTATKALAYTIQAMHKPGDIGYSPQAKSGGVIAMNPNNGDILAMASYPSYNPQKLVPNNPQERSRYYAQIATNPARPMEIRPIMGLYAPGSVFKPIMAVAALASKVITPTAKIYDPGYFPLIPSFHSWEYPGSFGWLNIKQAIGLSDDTFFYTLGYRMGIHVMDSWMRKFKLNQLTGIDLPGEVRSAIPTPARLQQDQQATWTTGWNLNTVIGQGISQYTLIALARADSAIANGGTLYWPHLGSYITTASGKMVKRIKPVVQGKLNVPSWLIHTVHTGMEYSAQDSNIANTGTSGTGYPTLVGFPRPLASKTGTAQKAGPYNNAFFLTYGPMPHPTILILVYINDGNWGARSGYVARAIYDQYFKVADPAAQASFDSIFGQGYPWPFGYKAHATSAP